jgi:uncharacterized protein
MIGGPDRLGDAGVRDVNWLLDNFVGATAGVDGAVAVSSDGLVMAIAPALPRAAAEKLAAAISGLTSLALSTSRILDKGPMRQVVAEFSAGYLLVSAIGDGSCLGVITEAGCDLGIVAFETTMLMRRVGSLLTPELISELKTHAMR